MTYEVIFLSPKMVGKRFEDHSVPLELLKDLAVVEEMFIEIAKWKYKLEHSERKNVPKGFTESVSLKLGDIKTGCAIPVIRMSYETDELIPIMGSYLEQARDSFVGAINAATFKERIEDHLPKPLLAYFDRLGRGLKDGESIEFTPDSLDRKAALTPEVRKVLVQASQISEKTNEVKFNCRISEYDKGNMTCQVEQPNCPKIRMEIPSHLKGTVDEAFYGYEKGALVLLQGVGKFNENDKLIGFESVEHLSILDPNDIGTRIEELKGLSDGWLGEGKGLAPKVEGLDWVNEAFHANYPEELAFPFLYPTAEGGVQAEWEFGDFDMSFQINLENKSGYWHSLNLKTDEDEAIEIDLCSKTGWVRLIELIKKNKGAN